MGIFCSLGVGGTHFISCGTVAFLEIVPFILLLQFILQSLTSQSGSPNSFWTNFGCFYFPFHLSFQIHENKFIDTVSSAIMFALKM